MLVICDFDGTITARDTNTELARRFAPAAQAAVEGALADRSRTLRDVLDTEVSAIRAEHADVVAAACEVPLRAGAERLVDEVAARGDELVLLSSGFRQLIEPMLARAGLEHRVPLLANDVAFGPEGGRITWRELPTCERCGEPCKRHDVERLRDGALHGGLPFDRVAYVGDGFSDRCGAEAADRVFALEGSSLAGYLDDAGHRHDPFRDLHDVAEALAAWT